MAKQNDIDWINRNWTQYTIIQVNFVPFGSIEAIDVILFNGRTKKKYYISKKELYNAFQSNLFNTDGFEGIRTHNTLFKYTS